MTDNRDKTTQNSDLHNSDVEELIRIVLPPTKENPLKVKK